MIFSFSIPSSSAKRSRAKTNRTRHRKHDIGPFVIKVLRKGAAIVEIVEIVGEQPFARGHVPSQNRDRIVFLGVPVIDTFDKPVHEDRDWRNVDTAKGAQDFRLGHAGGKISRQKSSLISGIDLSQHVRQSVGS